MVPILPRAGCGIRRLQLGTRDVSQLPTVDKVLPCPYMCMLMHACCVHAEPLCRLCGAYPVEGTAVLNKLPLPMKSYSSSYFFPARRLGRGRSRLVWPRRCQQRVSAVFPLRRSRYARLACRNRAPGASLLQPGDASLAFCRRHCVGARVACSCAPFLRQRRPAPR